MKTKLLSWTGLALLLLAPCHIACAAVDEADTNQSKTPSGLPVPRFASLRSDEVNMRTGPGTRYPIEWVFKRQGLPVEVISEYEVWRRVRDPDGAEGWVHESALSGKRSVIVTAPHDLLDDADPKAAVVAHVQAGVVGQLVSCSKDWCKLRINGIKGYLPRGDFWGAKVGEKLE
ncbi:MAG: SH3 domain-containing protein [Pseudomonadota bacterium]|nr:SH3 domain-containing protein [Pseudomonadota bacterium]